MKVCTTCRKTVRNDARFCPSCGSAMSRAGSGAGVGDGLVKLGESLVESSKNLASAAQVRAQSAPVQQDAGHVNSAQVQRPFGMVIVVLYVALNGLTTLIAGALLTFAGQVANEILGFIGPLVGSGSGEAFALTLAGVVGLAVGFLMLASCYGLWSYQAWGRSLALVIFILTIITTFIGFFVGSVNASTNLVNIVSIAASAGVVWYLTRRDVVERFA